ncbi:hypothetical protein CSB37_01060 [bacterium DOLZORAL124_38_8]|nr:MAG: hypothetical protein CSB37_01060 [bacterium DOLZORAL124_38_8]
MNVFLIEKKGVFKPLEIRRPEILEQFELYTRDLRPILSHKQVSTVSRRKKALIVNLNNVKFLVGRNKALLFTTTERSFPKLKEFLEDKMSTYRGVLPFELFLLDQAFFFVITQLRERVQKIEKEAQKVESTLSDNPTDAYLERLLSLKKKLGKVSSEIQSYDEILEEFLDDDENLADLRFLKNPTPDQLEEVESVVENLSQQVEQTSNKIDEIDENLEDSQEILSLKIANMRNTIIRFDLVISVITTVFSFLAVVVGLYGMNVKNGYESSSEAFGVILGLLGVFTLVSLVFMWYQFKRTRIF